MCVDGSRPKSLFVYSGVPMDQLVTSVLPPTTCSHRGIVHDVSFCQGESGVSVAVAHGTGLAVYSYGTDQTVSQRSFVQPGAGVAAADAVKYVYPDSADPRRTPVLLVGSLRSSDSLWLYVCGSDGTDTFQRLTFEQRGSTSVTLGFTKIL